MTRARAETVPLTSFAFPEQGFTAVYGTPNNHYGTVLYGVIPGFVLYLAIELAARLGAAGAFDPTFAAAGAGSVAFVVGLSVLFCKHNGRA